jgi:hypothetical protein
MKMSGGVELYLHAFFFSALDGDEWSISRHGRFIHTKRAPGIHFLGDWLGLKDVV